MTTEIKHQPTPEFRDYLEGEITREFRRHRSFARLRFATIVLATLAAGTTAGLASAQVRQGAQRDSLLETAESDLALIGARLRMAQQILNDFEAREKVGAVGRNAVVDATAELRQIEALAMKAKLNVDEIRASAFPPRDDLNAPLVGGRDFVNERLQFDLFLGQQRLTAAEQALAEKERQARAGTTSEFQVLEAGLRVSRERAALGVLVERRTLRKEFVDQGTAGDELNRRFRHAQVRFDVSVAQQSVKLLQQRVQALQKMRAVGSASEVDVLRAELELKERELELQMLARQLRELAKPPA
jgi:hypothetical protein